MLRYRMSKLSIVAVSLFVSVASYSDGQKTPSKKVILYVWDGLRPDSLTDPNAHIPNLRAFAKQGVEFRHNHSAYPTFTMDNAQVFATGNYAGKTGFYGNVLYEPWRAEHKDWYGKAINAKGEDITEKFSQPIFTEDYEILKDLNGKSADGKHDEPLVQVTTLLKEAHKAGLKTAVVGKSGPAFFQDYEEEGLVLEENHVWPLSFAKELQKQHISLPKNSPIDYPSGALVLDKNNGDPTKPTPVVHLKDDVMVSNPKAGKLSPFNSANEYMAGIFINQIIPKKSPDLSVLWMRNPDTTEHIYGPGSYAYYNALESNDRILGKLRSKLKELGLDKSTDIMIVSDHAHSNIVATKANDANGFPRLLVPLHEINKDGSIGKETKAVLTIDKVTNEKRLVTSGYSVSGTIRTAQLITSAQLKTASGKTIVAYDGGGCFQNFALSAMRLSNGALDTSSSAYHTADGQCFDSKKESIPYTSHAYFVPKNLEQIKETASVVIGANGGSDYVYIPSHDPEIAKVLVSFFQRREEYSALFVDAKRYPAFETDMPGALSLDLVKLQNLSGRNPDIVVSMTSNANVVVNGLPGTEFDSESAIILRGTHGSFGKNDVHNTLLALGPDFQSRMIDTLPTGNVDVAPTIGSLFHISLPNTDGRLLLESVKGSGVRVSDYRVEPLVVQSSLAKGLSIYEPTTHEILFDKDSQNIDTSVHSFQTEVHAQKLILKDKESHMYFDYAQGIRR
jgi:predicted AlkP superfamily pyrophosphatase or phosphodiesterase